MEKETSSEGSEGMDFGEESSEDVWHIIKKLADEDHQGDVVEAYANEIRGYHDLKKDETHQQVMSTYRRYINGKDSMELNEALANAIEKRKHLILQTTDGRDDEHESTIWDTIIEEANTNFDGDMLKAYSSEVVWNWRLQNDDNHQKIMATLNRFLNEEEGMEFEEALTNTMVSRKNLILRLTDQEL